MKLACAIAVTLFVSLAAHGRSGQEQGDAKLLEGTWLPAIAELAGKDFPGDVSKTIKLTVKGDQYKVTVGDKSDQGTIKLDPTKTPKTMDITGTEGPNKGKTILAIYELDQDRLKICYDLGAKERPTEFQTKAKTQLFLVTYKREKP